VVLNCSGLSRSVMRLSRFRISEIDSSVDSALPLLFWCSR